MNLQGGLVRMSAAMKDRVRALLGGGCACGATECRLTRRRVHASVSVHLQCLGCGKSLGGALPRAEFFFYQDYPEWDEQLRWAYQRERDARQGELAPEHAAASAERRERYHDWLERSPEWATLRARVMTRADRTCEACLAAPASHVHHISYTEGLLPPAWWLRAVCAKCHDRLHSGWRE